MKRRGKRGWWQHDVRIPLSRAACVALDRVAGSEDVRLGPTWVMLHGMVKRLSFYYEPSRGQIRPVKSTAGLLRDGQRWLYTDEQNSGAIQAEGELAERWARSMCMQLRLAAGHEETDAKVATRLRRYECILARALRLDPITRLGRLAEASDE